MAEGLIGSMTGTAPLLAGADLYYRLHNGQSANPFHGMGSSLSNLFGSFGSSGGNGGPGFTSGDVSHAIGDLSNMGYGSMGGQGGAVSGGGPNSGISYGAPPQQVPGMGSVAGGVPTAQSYSPGAAPIGGYWNQQALNLANPAYGPYAGIGALGANG